jgi:hypothetical protein
MKKIAEKTIKIFLEIIITRCEQLKHFFPNILDIMVLEI